METRAATQSAQCAAGAFAELPEVLRTNIGQFVLLPVPPQVLNRIEFRRVGRQVLSGDPSVQTGEEFADQTTLVRGQSIPDDQQGRGYLAEEVGEKHDDLFFRNGFIEKLEIEIPQRHTRRHRNGPPVEVILEDRIALAVPRCDSGAGAGSIRFRR